MECFRLILKLPSCERTGRVAHEYVVANKLMCVGRKASSPADIGKVDEASWRSRKIYESYFGKIKKKTKEDITAATAAAFPLPPTRCTFTTCLAKTPTADRFAFWFLRQEMFRRQTNKTFSFSQVGLLTFVLVPPCPQAGGILIFSVSFVVRDEEDVVILSEEGDEDDVGSTVAVRFFSQTLRCSRSSLAARDMDQTDGLRKPPLAGRKIPV